MNIILQLLDGTEFIVQGVEKIEQTANVKKEEFLSMKFGAQSREQQMDCVNRLENHCFTLGDFVLVSCGAFNVNVGPNRIQTAPAEETASVSESHDDHMKTNNKAKKGKK